MPGWISIVLWIITNGPTIYKIVKEILDLIGSIGDKTEKEQALTELKAAIGTHSNEGFKLPKRNRRKPDFKRLNDMMERLRDRHKA